jgi:outer membrane protein assembly factor BamA
MRRRVISRFLLAFAIVVLSARAGLAQEAQTREEELQREREAKAAHLEPYPTTTTGRIVGALEDGRVFERFLNPPEGFYPRIATVTSGSGFSFGVAYRRPRLFGDRAVFSSLVTGSVKKYWMYEGRLAMPELAGGKAFLELYGQRFEYPEENFFGLGPASRREDQSNFTLRNSGLGVSGGVRLAPWLTLSTGMAWLTPGVGHGQSDQLPSVEEVFDVSQIPGFTDQPAFIRYEVVAEANYRTPRANPRKGGRYTLQYEYFDDRDSGHYRFGRFDTELQQYIPFLNERRTIALRARLSAADAAEGHEVPFYFLRTLGGDETLRGFRKFRFRDSNLLLMQAEYRWEIFTAVDGAIFYDTGKVAPRFADINLDHLESNYGIGFRFGSNAGIFLRVEAAFGSSAGNHFIFAFGNVF